jgi:hypothetical protein
MAITLELTPFGWTARGQKMVFRVSSTEVGQPNFKFGASVTRGSDGKVFEFICEPNPLDFKLYFDVQPLVKLTNMELNSEGDIPHFAPLQIQINEPLGRGYETYTLTFTEYWNVAGNLTPAGATSAPAAFSAFNGYLQPIYGFRPNPETGVAPVRFAMTGITDFVWSNRWLLTTRKPDDLPFSLSPPYTQYVWVPAYDTDWGVMALPIGKAVMASNDATKIQLIGNTGTSNILEEYTYANSPFAHVGVYPQNLNAGTGGFKPATYPNWTYYAIWFKNSANVKKSVTYVFYNANKYGGRNDCRYDPIRIGWVSSRGGWDYFTFVKRSEWTNDTERKQYTRLIENGTSEIFDPGQRQNVDREVAVSRTITLTSDWLEENEFIYLRNMFNSRQIVLLDTPQPTPIPYNLGKGVTTPATLVDKTLVEQRGRNGKLVNVTIKLKVAQDYWT